MCHFLQVLVVTVIGYFWKLNCWLKVHEHFTFWKISHILNVVVLFSCSYLTLPDPVDCNLPGSSVHGISQARILEWVTISFSATILLWMDTHLLLKRICPWLKITNSSFLSYSTSGWLLQHLFRVILEFASSISPWLRNHGAISLEADQMVYAFSTEWLVDVVGRLDMVIS